MSVRSSTDQSLFHSIDSGMSSPSPLVPTHADAASTSAALGAQHSSTTYARGGVMDDSDEDEDGSSSSPNVLYFDTPAPAGVRGGAATAKRSSSRSRQEAGGEEEDDDGATTRAHNSTRGRAEKGSTSQHSLKPTDGTALYDDVTSHSRSYAYGSASHGDDIDQGNNPAGLPTSSRGSGYRAVNAHGLLEDPSGVTPLTEAQRKKLYWHNAIIVVALILSWYTFSTLMNVYNSWLFSKKRHGFAYPLLTTSMHMFVQFGLSSAMLYGCAVDTDGKRGGGRSRGCTSSCCGGNDGGLGALRRRMGLERPHVKALFGKRATRGEERAMEAAGEKRKGPHLIDWATKVVPCAFATALDIGLSNLSLKSITLTFYTMCKSSNLAFVLIFAFIFGLEKVRLSLIGIITIITIGVIMMVAAETQFVLEGAIEVLTASAMGGLRWALTQMLLDRESMGMTNPISTVWWLAPPMAGCMILMSLVVESWSELANSPFFESWSKGIQTAALMIAPGAIAFCMNLSEFALIRRTSVVTLSVAGIFKEIFTVLLSSTIFGDELTAVNVTGLCVALTGIGLYNYLKYRLIVSGGGGGGGGGGASGGHGGGAVDGATGHSHTTGGRRGGGYAQLGHDSSAPPGQEFEEGEETERDVLFLDEEAEADGTNSLAMSQRSLTSSHLSERERERRRKIEEEADMEGAAFSYTSNGFYEEEDDEEEQHGAEGKARFGRR